MYNFYYIAINEIRKELLLVWSYRIQWICEIVALTLFFFFLSRMNYAFSKDSDLEFSLMSYATWFYAILIIGDMAGKLANEMRTGTFEQISLAVVSMPWILVARVFTSIIRATALFLLLMIPLATLFSIHISFHNIGLFFVVFGGLLPGLLGLSFLLGGITFILKEAGPIINIVNNTLLFLSGGFVPLDTFPSWVVMITKYLPTTQAINIFRVNRQLSTHSFFPFSNSGISSLVVHSFIYLLIGLFAFLYLERKAKSEGTLGHY